MKKMTLMQVEEYRKRYKEQTTVVLKSDGFISGEGIQQIEFDIDDKFLPDLGTRLFVSIESIPDLGPRTWSEATGDPYQKWIDDRRAESEQGVKPTRKFR